MRRQTDHARHVRHALQAVLLAGAVVAWLVPALPAGAKVVHSEQTHDSIDVLLPPPGEEFCGFDLLTVPLHVDVIDNELVKTKGGSVVPYFGDSFQVTDVYTNPGTGKTYTVESSGSAHDHTIVDNGDGTINIATQQAGQTMVRGPSGDVLFTDRGLIEQTILIDLNGTPADPDDDVFLGEVGPPTFRGPHDTVDRDFCADFIAYTS